MRLPEKLEGILDAALAGRAPGPQDCAWLLALPPESLETSATLAVADAACRRRFGNAAMLLGQIGVETAPCPGNCGFCAFGEGHTRFERSRLSTDEVLRRARDLADGGDLFALFLMTMHEVRFPELLALIQAVRGAIPPHTQIVVNIGDFDLARARELRAAGADGAYHVCRLREGTDTALDPAQRLATLRTIREGGLDLYTCCEPVGPEHTPEELAEQIFLGIEHGCFQHAAMRRVAVPGAPLSAHGQITERRLAQLVAVVSLATLACPHTASIAVHEPNLLGLCAGANTVYAETGANPRDTEADTATHRGRDMAACRQMLLEAGFTALRRRDGTSLPLAPATA